MSKIDCINFLFEVVQVTMAESSSVMDTLVAQLAEMKSSLQSLQAAVNAHETSQTMEEDLSTEDSEFCPAQEKWSAILGTSAE